MAKTTKTGVLTTPTAKATTVLEDSSPVLPLPDTPQGVMAVGPRVTFHFVQDYNQANSYDYYDVVNVDGTSYIAIQDVPANTQITDTEYWVKWNDPNAQFALLQETVETFDSRITSAETTATDADQLANENKTRLDSLQKYMVVVGDSFSTSNLTETPLWCDIVAQKLGCELKNFAVSGGGFVSGSVIQNQLSRAVNDGTFPNDQVEYVFIYSGCNDSLTGNSITTIGNQMNQCFDIANESFPNALIINACNNWPQSIYDSGDYSQSLAFQIALLANARAITRGVLSYPTFQWLKPYEATAFSDNNHPTALGSSLIASMFLGLLGYPVSVANGMALATNIPITVDGSYTGTIECSLTRDQNLEIYFNNVVASSALMINVGYFMSQFNLPLFSTNGFAGYITSGSDYKSFTFTPNQSNPAFCRYDVKLFGFGR